MQSAPSEVFFLLTAIAIGGTNPLQRGIKAPPDRQDSPRQSDGRAVPGCLQRGVVGYEPNCFIEMPIRE